MVLLVSFLNCIYGFAVLLLWFNAQVLVLGDTSDPCNRPCKSNDVRTCHYNFTIREHLSFSKACYNCPFNLTDCYHLDCVPADGRQKGILTVNHKIPGPDIQVCSEDNVVIDVFNKMTSMGITIHWHGIHQGNLPHLDGVPMITQCPIIPWTTFRYSFPANQIGTFFWHAHFGLEKMDGLFGAFIVRTAEDPMAHLYDYDRAEHVIVVNDWLPEPAIDMFLKHYHSNGTNHPRTILVNGIATDNVFTNKDGQTVRLPHQVFMIEQGKRYRFRLISSGTMNAPIKVSVDGHVMTVIATDGAPTEPMVTDSLVIYSGERFDFVLEANQTVANYWIKFRALIDGGELYTQSYETAILRYKGAPSEDPPELVSYQSSGRLGKELNPVNGVEDLFHKNIDLLNATIPDDETLLRTPDYKFFVAYDFDFDYDPAYPDPVLYPVSSFPQDIRRPLTLFNNISFLMPPFPLLTQRDEIPASLICNSTSIKENCTRHFCNCIHILKVSLDSVVELIFIDRGNYYNASHMIHLHGHYFRVVAMGTNEEMNLEYVQNLDKENKIQRKLHKAVMKDTVNVPYKGFAVLRFLAKFPGYWLLHCHMDFHLGNGMALVFQVGEQNQMPATPEHFPQCGNWLPNN